MGIRFSKFRKAKHVVAQGVDPILGSDPYAFRYEAQVQGPKPKYYNPYTHSSHARTASATWESYTGKVAGFPRPPVEATSPSEQRPARVGPVPPRASVQNVEWRSTRDAKPKSKKSRKRGVPRRKPVTTIQWAGSVRPPSKRYGIYDTRMRTAIFG
ncbi:hypothetical protein G7Z17_g1127 [Cylindrodendrum hubeiense]|uniref:Uncharacterized protein n=1 Tax=Cylindrodendrum hubeiense TaxID=595255 RepID=A0A9P5LMC6_9HYPO|nr:hypothetical protein G7Z17_g1127 [Cylindrodendrum hubeiense]